MHGGEGDGVAGEVDEAVAGHSPCELVLYHLQKHNIKTISYDDKVLRIHPRTGLKDWLAKL